MIVMLLLRRDFGMDKNDVQDALRKAGLERLVEHIDLLVRPSIRISPLLADEAKLAPGTSKIGGLPDLPEGSAWPEWQGVPQSFIAQLRLEELQGYDTEKLLPAKGMLWFFYDAQQDVYGDDPTNKGAWQVLFSENPAKLQRASAPAKLPKEALFKANTLSYANELSMAVQPELEIAGLQWDNNEQKKYDPIFAAFHQGDDGSLPHHRMLGFADVLQDDMREQSLFNSQGITDWESPEARKLAAAEANSWQLLLQIDSDEKSGIQWASAGRLYYWGKDTELRAGQFAQTWVVLQSE
jgi:uncharacterized protein YwqG